MGGILLLYYSAKMLVITTDTDICPLNELIITWFGFPTVTESKEKRSSEVAMLAYSVTYAFSAELSTAISTSDVWTLLPDFADISNFAVRPWNVNPYGVPAVIFAFVAVVFETWWKSP